MPIVPTVYTRKVGCGPVKVLSCQRTPRGWDTIGEKFIGIGVEGTRGLREVFATLVKRLVTLARLHRDEYKSSHVLALQKEA
jgi:hypothetical protein